MFGRLVVYEILVNRFLQLSVFNNSIGAHPFVVLSDSSFVLRVCCVVPSAFPRLLEEFIRYRSLCYANAIGDFFLSVTFADKNVNLVSVAFRESLFFCFFMRLS